MDLLGRINIGGQKLRAKKIDSIVDHAIDNIVLSGFTNTNELYNIIKINSSNSGYISNLILNKLLTTYSENLKQENSDKSVVYHPNNVISIGEKLKIVIDLITDIASKNFDNDGVNNTVDNSEDDYKLTEEEEQLLLENNTEKVDVSCIIDNLLKNEKLSG